jgi:DNA-binding FadR family transcriptional regulator
MSSKVLPPGRVESAYLEHVAIVEASERRDPDGAEEADRGHSRVSERLRLKWSFAGGSR